MKLVIGGCFQGKLEYVLREETLENYLILDRELPSTEQLQEMIDHETIVIINHLHEYIRTELLCGKNPEKKIPEFINSVPNSIVISDEIGNGIVPIERFEREYRERTGRILVELAKQADEVVRVVCGMGQKIK